MQLVVEPGRFGRDSISPLRVTGVSYTYFNKSPLSFCSIINDTNVFRIGSGGGGGEWAEDTPSA